MGLQFRLVARHREDPLQNQLAVAVEVRGDNAEGVAGCLGLPGRSDNDVGGAQNARRLEGQQFGIAGTDTDGVETRGVHILFFSYGQEEIGRAHV